MTSRPQGDQLNVVVTSMVTHDSYKTYLETSQLYLPTTQPCIVAFVITICTIIVHPKKGEFSRRFQSKKATLEKKELAIHNLK